MQASGNILVIDRDRETVAAIQASVSDAEYGCIHTISAVSAEELLGQQSFDLVLLDVTSADGPVKDVCERIVAAAGPGAQPGVIVLTQPGQRVWSLARTVESVIAVVPKPIVARALLATIDDAMRRRLPRAVADVAGATSVPEPVSVAASEAGAVDQLESRLDPAAVKVAARRAIEGWDGRDPEQLVDQVALALTVTRGGSDAPAPKRGVVERGKLMACSDVMSLEELMQSLAGMSATGTLRICNTAAALDLRIRSGRLSLIHPSYVEFAGSGEIGLFGLHVALPAETVAPREGDGRGSGMSPFVVFAGTEVAVLHEDIVLIAIDTLRRLLDHAGGYTLEFVRQEPMDLPSFAAHLDLDLDIRSFLLRALSMIDEYRDVSANIGIDSQRFRAIESLNLEKLSLSEPQARILAALAQPQSFLDLVNGARMNPMCLTFELYALLEMRLLEVGDQSLAED